MRKQLRRQPASFWPSQPTLWHRTGQPTGTEEPVIGIIVASSLLSITSLDNVTVAQRMDKDLSRRTPYESKSGSDRHHKPKRSSQAQAIITSEHQKKEKS